MLPVSALSMGVLALSTQFFSPVVALSGDAQQIYTEWKQSSYYNQAVQVVNTIGGTAAGSYSSSTKTDTSSSASSVGDVSVGSLESNETITIPSSSGSSGSSATITSSSSGSSIVDSTTVTTITETEEQKRFDQALAIIAELQELHPHANFSINTPFVLLTSEEFLAYVNRFAIDPATNPVKTSTSTSSTAGMFTTDAEGPNTTTLTSSSGEIMTSAAASGETVDWQKTGCVTAVKDQGECGACWAFSATAAMESGYCVATGGSLPNLADQQLISCDGENGNNGCGGGYAAYTMDWIANERSGKMCTLDTYPFVSDNGNVPSCAMSSCTEFDVGVTGYESVHEDAGAIEDAVRNQPVSIFLYSGSSAFQFYSGGVLTGENCDKTGSHSGLAVGFGETDDNLLYWRIKNQWGTSWGEDGYVRVERRYSGDSEGACGVELYATWPTFDVSSSPTSAPSATTATPSVTTATPSTTPSTTSAPTVTSVPSTTTATPTTNTPSATKAGQNVVDQTTASGSNSVLHETVDQVASASSDSTEYAALNSDTSASAATPSISTPKGVIQSDSVAGEASYDTTPSTEQRDCAM
ncbi:Papain-like cysteine protease C1 [Phytophthora palmivora]|uniref:Papain-like cysteine protease C1 n=1 Tax=Phytophthora palmivora TaxID=4796 RepID=A0A2P4XUZ3_9STRA|nr:Papain-like cysteine protease C1 [Phytophthora palmivora]